MEVKKARKCIGFVYGWALVQVGKRGKVGQSGGSCAIAQLYALIDCALGRLPAGGGTVPSFVSPL